nr:MAG TPA: hypothetical protein [Caudoviricetes sp.]
MVILLRFSIKSCIYLFLEIRLALSSDSLLSSVL